MKKLTQEEKEQLRKMLERHSVELNKKRQAFINFKVARHTATRRSPKLGTLKFSQGLEQHMSKHQKLQEQTRNQILKQRHLTEKEKEELKAKIQAQQKFVKISED